MIRVNSYRHYFVPSATPTIPIGQNKDCYRSSNWWVGGWMLGEVSYQLRHAIEFRNVTPNLHYLMDHQVPTTSSRQLDSNSLRISPIGCAPDTGTYLSYHRQVKLLGSEWNKSKRLVICCASWLLSICPVLSKGLVSPLSR